MKYYVGGAVLAGALYLFATRTCRGRALVARLRGQPAPDCGCGCTGAPSSADAATAGLVDEPAPESAMDASMLAASASLDSASAGCADADTCGGGVEPVALAPLMRQGL